jgi:hypothetical protein
MSGLTGAGPRSLPAVGEGAGGAVVRNVAFKLVDNVIVAAYGRNSPTDEEARQMADFFRQIIAEPNLKSLSYTPGGAPTATQRRLLQDVMNGRELLAAVVTSSALVRGIVTAVSWFNRKMKVFSSHEEEDAFRYLGIPETQFETFRGEAKRLQKEVSL